MTQFVSIPKVAVVTTLPAAADNQYGIVAQGGKLWFSDGTSWMSFADLNAPGSDGDVLVNDSGSIGVGSYLNYSYSAPYHTLNCGAAKLVGYGGINVNIAALQADAGTSVIGLLSMDAKTLSDVLQGVWSVEDSGRSHSLKHYSDGTFTYDDNNIWHAGNLLNIGTTASSARTALELGTAATQDTGTSGDSVAKTNGENIWSAAQTVSLNEASPTKNTLTAVNPNTASGAQVRASLQRGGDSGTGTTKGAVWYVTDTTMGFADYEARHMSFLTGATAGAASERLAVKDTGQVVVGSSTTGRAATWGSAYAGTLLINGEDTSSLFPLLVSGVNADTRLRLENNCATVSTANKSQMDFALPTDVQSRTMGFFGWGITDTADATRSSKFFASIYKNAVSKEFLSANATTGEIVINDAGEDFNFRVESDSDTDALFLDAGTGEFKVKRQLKAGPNAAYVPAISMLAYSNASTQQITSTLTTVNVWSTAISGVGASHSAGVFTLQPGRLYLVTAVLGWDVTAGSSRGEVYGEVQANIDSGGYALANGGKIFGYERLVGKGSLGSGTCQAIIDATSATTSVTVQVQVRVTATNTVYLQADACSLKIEEVVYG